MYFGPFADQLNELASSPSAPINAPPAIETLKTRTYSDVAASRTPGTASNTPVCNSTGISAPHPAEGVGQIPGS
jgi:hypothetical protein